MLKSFLVILLTLLILISCSPLATESLPVTTPERVNSTATLPATLEPTLTLEATVEPLKLPVDRFTNLPELAPLTGENVKNLEAVGTFKESQLIHVEVAPQQDRAAFAFGNGIQLFDLPGLTAHSFLPLDLRDVGGRRIFRLSADARSLAVISKTENGQPGNQLVLWNLETGQKTCTLTFDAPVSPGGSGPLTMDFFPETGLFLFDGRLGSLEGQTARFTSEVRLVDLNNCQAIFQLKPRLGPVLEVSPDGRYLVYVPETPQNYGDQAYLFDTSTKIEQKIGEAGNLRGVGFAKDSKAVIIANSYQTKMYDLASGEVLAQLEANLGKNIVHLYPLQDNQRILIAGNESNRIWDYVTGENYSPGNDFITSHREMFDDHPGVIVTTESVWNLESKNAVSLKKYPFGRSASAFSADGRYMAVDSGYAPWQTDLVDLTTSQVIARFPGERAPVAVGDGFITSGKGQSYLHRFDNGELVTSLDFQYVDGLEGETSQTLVWDVQGNLRLLDASGAPTAQATLPVLPLAYYSTPDLYTAQHVFPAWEPSLDSDLSLLLAGIGRSTVLMAPDGQSVIQMSGEKVQIFRVENGVFHPTPETLLAEYPFKGVWFQFAFSPDGSLVAGKTFSQLLVWDAKTGKQVRAVAGAEYLKNAWYNLGFSPDGSLLALDSIGQKDRTLTLLEVQTGKVVQTHSVANCQLDLPFAFTLDGSSIFTVTPDCRIGLYTLDGWQKQAIIGGPYSGAKLALALSPDGKFLAVGQKSDLEIWDAQSGMLLKRFNLETGIENFIGDFALAFAPDGKSLIARYGFGNRFFFDTTVMLFGVPIP